MHNFQTKSRPDIDDPNVIMKALQVHWDDFHHQITQVDEDEIAEIRDFFNDLIEEDDQLGDKLLHDEFDGPGNLGETLQELGPDITKKFTDALLENDCIDRECLDSAE